MIRKAAFDPDLTNDYPTSDGRPMAETDFHRILMVELIETLQHRYAADPMVYVSGNLLVFYEEGNKRRHVAPDVFAVRGVPNRKRLNYRIWVEGKGPEVVIELTSKTTKAEDVKKKFALYRDRLGVTEYFLFDPFEDYLTPSMQGFRRFGSEFRLIKPVAGRLSSKVLGLHLERDGNDLRLWNPESETWLATPKELIATAERARREAETEMENERNARLHAESETERLRRENEELRRKLSG